MQRLFLMGLISCFLIFLLPGCGVIEVIFKAGMWWAFILVFLVVFLGAWIYIKTRKK
jgi:hypothetical protein